jgi:creatinine amidohydrolase
MARIIFYEELTWPEVEKLDRTLPIILTSFAHKSILWRKYFPQGAIILPPIPYGWGWDGLVNDEESMVAILNQLTTCMVEQGFEKVLFVSDSKMDGLHPNLHYLNIHSLLVNQAREEGKILNDTGWNQIFIEGSRERVVLIPIGQVEQHGLHAPLSTDTEIVEAICNETAKRMPDTCLTLPVMPYGVSTHRRNFPGTLSCNGRTFEDFCLSLADSLVNWGYKKIYFISGHGGNVSYLTNVVKSAGEKYPDAFIATAWLYLSGPEGVKSLEENRESAIGGMGHACELETSLMLYLKPNLVHMDRVVDETDFITTPSYYMDWIEGGALIANPPWTDDTRTGAYGAGSKATATKGRIWFEVAVKEKMAHVLEINEQYQRRLEKKHSANTN